MTPKPCPFCGHVGITIVEGSTFRWRQAECESCGARCGEVRVRTDPGRPTDWQEHAALAVLDAWNTRKGVEGQVEPQREVAA